MELSHFLNVFENTLKREKRKLELMKDPKEKPYQIGFFEGINQIYAIHDMIINKDFISARGRFYKCATVIEYLYKINNEDIYSSTRNFCYPILSDNSDVINRFSNFNKVVYSDSFTTLFGQAIQAIIKDNYSDLIVIIDKLNQYKFSNDWEVNYIGSVNFFKGIFIKDTSLVMNGLDDLLRAHAKHKEPKVIGEFFSIEATALAKMAWRKGFKISIESEYIPKDLLPVVELDLNDKYGFLNELDSRLGG